ncbi:MAG: hypothetical protein ACREDF_11505, partial [Thermoplasmata archaeon]
MRARAAFLLVLLMLATAALVVESQTMLDPLAPFRTPDGHLTIPGRALTPELQRLLFHRNELQPFLRLTFLIAERSAYPTLHSVPTFFDAPNLNVFIHPSTRSETWGSPIARLIRQWFPPVNWNAVGDEVLTSVRAGVGWFFNLLTVNARSDTLSVDSTTVAVVEPAASTCTTSQTAAAGDNGILVMLSNRPETFYTTVTYGSVSLSLIAGTASSGTGFVRNEMWFYQGKVPAGVQTMTATLTSGTAKHVCATILLRGVAGASPTVGGTTASGITMNPDISISPAAGELAFAVLAIRGATAPTAVTGTGGTASSLYGITPTQCTTGGTYLCGAGAHMPNPGTAITWTDSNGIDWVISAVRVVPASDCSVAAGNCYRIGAGGAWNTAANWSNTSGGATCSCTPVATNNANFDANPTGTTTLAAATTIASVDMTGFTGTLDTTASNWALTVNGAFSIQGTFLARNSTVTVTGDIDILTAATIVNLGASTWTINGTWTNSSTSASWNAGTGTVTFTSATGGTMTFAGANLASSEFSTVVFNGGPSTVSFTMASRGLVANAITIAGGPGTTTLATSGSSLPLTANTLTVAGGGSLAANGSVITVGLMNASAGSFAAGTSTVVVNASGGSISVSQALHSLTVNPGIST